MAVCEGGRVTELLQVFCTYGLMSTLLRVKSWFAGV